MVNSAIVPFVLTYQSKKSKQIPLIFFSNFVAGESYHRRPLAFGWLGAAQNTRREKGRTAVSGEKRTLFHSYPYLLFFLIDFLASPQLTESLL